MKTSFWSLWKKDAFAKDLTPEAVEFQPDALEILHQPLPWWGRWSVLWIACFFALAITWACIGRMDIFVTSMGTIVSRTPTLIMKPLERTVIKSIYIEVGQSVKEGQQLIVFDPVFSQSDVQRLNNEMVSLAAQFERLQAEFNKSEFSAAKDAVDDVRWQESIYIMRKQFYDEKMTYFTEELNRIEQSRASAKKSFTKQEEGLRKSWQVEKMLRKGSSSRIASPREFAEFQISRIKMEAEILSLQGHILELASEASACKAKRNAFMEEWKKTTTEEMVQVRRDLVRTQQEYTKAIQLENYMTLRAPCDAIVHEIAPVSAGTAVREAESLITLVPLDGDLEIEAEIAAKDIGKVDTGAPVRVKLLAFPFQQYGTLEGTVRTLSENTFQKSQQKSQQQEEDKEEQSGSFYRARITFSTADNALLSDVRLIPGMEIQAEIRVGERSIISYLIHPLIKSLDESLREP